MVLYSSFCTPDRAAVTGYRYSPETGPPDSSPPCAAPHFQSPAACRPSPRRSARHLRWIPLSPACRRRRYPQSTACLAGPFPPARRKGLSSFPLNTGRPVQGFCRQRRRRLPPQHHGLRAGRRYSGSHRTQDLAQARRGLGGRLLRPLPRLRASQGLHQHDEP